MINYMSVPIKSEKNTIGSHAVNAMISYEQDKPYVLLVKVSKKLSFNRAWKLHIALYDTKFSINSHTNLKMINETFVDFTLITKCEELIVNVK